MTREEIAVRAELLAGATASEDAAAFRAICDMCAADVGDLAGYDGADDLPEVVGNIAVELAVHRWNLRGSEGVQAEGYSGVSQQLSQDVPPFILRRIRRVGKIRWG